MIWGELFHSLDCKLLALKFSIQNLFKAISSKTFLPKQFAYTYKNFSFLFFLKEFSG